jgi:hypothetical protein
MYMKKLLAGLPKKGEVAFVHYYHEAEPGSDVVVRGKGSPFKANIVSVNFEDEGIMYTVCHVTDNFTHVVHISDFVAMGDGSYPRMKRIAKADALTHKTWVRVMEDF